MRRNFLRSLAAVTAGVFCLKPSEAKQTGVITTITCGDITYFACDGELFKFEGQTSTHWYKNGKLHRIDGPAIEHKDGSKYWIQNGLSHREDGPALEYADGRKEWYINGQLHRLDGPAIEKPNGDKFWYQEGVLHRSSNGPSVEFAGGTSFYVNKL
jgi:hypothetical protein